MASEKSYGATLVNNLTELDAMTYLLSEDDKFIRLDKIQRAKIMDMLGLEKSFSRAFDLIYTPSGYMSVNELKLGNFVLVELKTTRKKLLNNPKGFFFGATENEFALARRMGDKYQFCFVSLHPESLSYNLMTLNRLKEKIRTKRIQYQINL